MTWSRVKDLFHRALEIPDPERKAWLAHEAGDDAALIAEVQSLLDSHEHSGQFLHPVSAEQRVAALGAGSTQSGDRIGAYRLVEMIGTGGMGDVYKAVRDDDQYKAEVAIKLMRADVRNPLAEQRFKTERQILAGLDHRNIARLLDGGTTPNGLPYVVMELVTGEPIDGYSDSHHLPTRERVRLFLQVCAAVSFAHRHLVVHRDIKPNNIFVTADGSVKLLDFGIAKLIENDPVTGQPTDETRTQLRAMTIEYASPEQVSGGIVTTVSDVYSLGVVLYRLLTGQSPYRASGGEAARVAEILSDTSPTRPSAVATLPRHSIDADLDNILLMALRKEPAKRYGSVEQFAGDLRNYLDGKPVSARRGTFAYRAGKFARRNNVSIAAASLVAASLIGGVGFAWREARIAERERAVAQRHFDSVRKLANKLFEFHDEIAALPGATKAREMLLKTSLEYLDALNQEAGADLALRKELGTAYLKVGDIQGSEAGGNTGDPKAAIQSYGKAIALFDSVVAAKPDDRDARLELARSHVQLAQTLLFNEGAEAAAKAGEKAVAASEAVPALPDEGPERTNTLATAYLNYGFAISALERLDEAFATMHKSVVATEAYWRKRPDDEAATFQLAKLYNRISSITDPRVPAVEAANKNILGLQNSLEMQERLLKLNPKEAKYRTLYAQTRFNVADTLFDAGRYAEAVDSFHLAVPATEVDAADLQNANAQWLHAMALGGLAKSLSKAGRDAEAEPWFTRSLEVLDRIPASGQSLKVQYARGQIAVRSGQMYMNLKNWRKARDALTLGTTTLAKVNESYSLGGPEKQVWDDGIAALKLAKSRLATNGH